MHATHLHAYDDMLAVSGACTTLSRVRVIKASGYCFVSIVMRSQSESVQHIEPAAEEPSRLTAAEQRTKLVRSRVTAARNALLVRRL